jgi:hypothetical protein
MAVGWCRLFGALASQAERVSQRWQVCRLGWRRVGKLGRGGPRSGGVAKPGPGQGLNGDVEAVIVQGPPVTGLRTLPSSQCYELWLLGPGQDKSAGMLPAPRQGKTGPVIATGLAPGDRLALTVEPADGSRHPTSPMILMLAL